MMMEIAIVLQNTCLWCDNRVPMDKMICSFRCLNQMRKAFKEQYPAATKDRFGYDASDVYRKVKK